jgi:peptidoglycan/LPS O-acetylase OafA/YrhL
MTLNIFVLPLVACTIYGFASLGFNSPQIIQRALINRVMLYLGDISYSFFLMQIPLMLWLDQNKSVYQHISTPILFATCLGATLLLAMTSFHLIEGRGRLLLLKVGTIVQRHRWHTN